MIVFSRSGHSVCVCRWGRRFRLPTLYVHAQTASPLASGRFGANLPLCYLAIGWVYAEESVYAGIGRRKRLPHFHSQTYFRTSVCCGRSRNGQGCLWARVVEGCASGTGGGRCTPAWREREAVLPAARLGDHAQSCACAVASEDRAVRDYAVGEGFHCTTSQFNPASHGRAILAG
jgi:hypothetical protein